MIFLIVMSINLLGDGVRDALDPRLRSGALARPMAATLVRRERVPERPDGGAGLLRLDELSAQFHVGPADLPRGFGGVADARARRVFGADRGKWIGQVGHGVVGDGVGGLTTRSDHRGRGVA